MESTRNYEKHTSRNLLQQFLINNFYQHLISLISKLEVKNVLDVGCGEGFTLERLRVAGIANQLEGVDCSAEAIEIGERLHPRLTFRYGNACALPYEDKSFDAVICTEVLEHLEKPRLAIAELKRVSKKHLIVSVPREPFFRGANLLRGKYLNRFGDHPEHIQHWSANGFKKLLTTQNLMVIRRETPFPWTIIHAENGVARQSRRH